MNPLPLHLFLFNKFSIISHYFLSPLTEEKESDSSPGEIMVSVSRFEGNLVWK